MNPMDRMYGGGMEDWGESARSYRPDDEYLWYSGPAGLGTRYGYGGLRYERALGDVPGERHPQRDREHVWRGGVLGWLGSGLRAGAAWVGSEMQSWGALLGGKLKGTGAELGRAMRGRGEQMGSAMEQRGERRYRRYEGRPPRSYHRPDDRILDDVHQRVALCGVDADEVEIEVSNGVVTLSGRVPHRFDKRLVEEVAEQVFGVQEVQNHLRIARRVDANAAADASGAAAAGNGQGAYRAGPEARS